MVLVFAKTLSYPNAQPAYPQGCQNAFRNITEGCRQPRKNKVRQPLHEFFHFHFGFSGLKKACCGTVVNVTDLCWPVLFPSQPNIRFMLKAICTKPNLH
ncbi:unnamed protein product [Brassica napus]|uniref:(rape) hypothetical protein n=1 Tax=Brassica napus TaxID=3708 RepID=A0A816YDJ6_BRANA|nr:unnamed protein product [Brassica napus]